MRFTASFDVQIAKTAGIDEALLHDWIQSQCFIRMAQEDQSSFHDNRWWVKCNKKTFDKIFPFWNERQVARFIENLTNKSLLLQRQGEDKQDIWLSVDLTVSFTEETTTKRKRKVREAEPTPTEEKVISYIRTKLDGSEEIVETTRGKVIGDLIDCFKYVNPGYAKFFAIPAQRRAIENMIDTYPINALFKLLTEFIPKTNAMQYAPIVTTPKEFERLAPKVIAFVRKKQDESDNNFQMKF